MDQRAEVHISLNDLLESERSQDAINARTCGICAEVCDALLDVSKQCGHRVCARCIAKHISATCFSGGAFETRCPYGDAMIDWAVVEQCGTEQQTSWLLTNMVNRSLRDQVERQYWRSLCEIGFISDNLEKCPQIQCPNCRRNSCQNCQVELQPDAKHECKTPQSSTIGDIGTRVVQCPGCSSPTIRRDGCNHMMCPCGVHYCWLCGVDITGRMNRHYAQECPRYGTHEDQERRGGPERRMEEGRGERDTVIQGEAKKRVVYLILFLTGAVTVPLIATVALAAIVASYYFVIVLFRVLHHLFFENPEYEHHYKHCSASVPFGLIMSLLLGLLPVFCIIVWVVVVVMLLVVIYIVMPVLACRYGPTHCISMFSF